MEHTAHGSAYYTGYNTTGTSYTQATTVANDVILTQSISTYNEAGSVISTAGYQRLNDAPATGTGSTGALSASANPKARIFYAAAWFDGIDRPMASANYGAISSFSWPSAPPASSATVLVSQTAYDDAGRAYQPCRVRRPPARYARLITSSTRCSWTTTASAS